ncbi:MAG TPA: hypothetical protein VFU21_15970, partial [Kofleriaceae bacterium]|nr:hypothetical protein [Kofleriaceae bacterium]
MPSAPAAFRVALLFLPAAACAVEGAGPEGLDEIQAVRPFEVDAGAIRPANCGSQEVLEVDLTNTSAASISAWAVFSTEYRIGTEEGAANPSETA